MSLPQQWNASACAWLFARLDTVSVAIAASLMVMIGNTITKKIRRRMKGWHFATRTLVFVLVNSIGFGMVVALAAPQLARVLLVFGASYLLFTTTLAFIGVGLYAERHRQI